MTPMGKNNMEHIKNKLITNFGVKIGFHALKIKINTYYEIKFLFSKRRKNKFQRTMNN